MRKATPGVWLVMAACLILGQGARAQNHEAMVAAAKREGSVTLYEGFPHAGLQALIIKSFQDKYAIRVDLLAGRSSELNERVRSEQAAGRFVADVLQQGESSTTLHIEAGRMDRLGVIPNAANVLPGEEATEFRVGGFVAPYAIMINTNLVKPGEEPKTWLDLLEPKWKGRVLLDDPRAAGGGGAFLAGTITLHGEDYHRRLALNNPTFTRDVGSAERRVASGEYAIWAPAMVASMNNLKGLPLRFLAPSEGVPSIRMDLTVLRNAPRPNAARLFIDHFLSRDFQADVARLGFLPIVHGVEQFIPEDLRPFARVKLLGGMTAERQQPLLKFATEVYK